jgi:hypothetical protein
MSQVFETYTFCAQKTDKSSVTEIRFTRGAESPTATCNTAQTNAVELVPACQHDGRDVNVTLRRHLFLEHDGLAIFADAPGCLCRKLRSTHSDGAIRPKCTAPGFETRGSS